MILVTVTETLQRHIELPQHLVLRSWDPHC